MDSHVHTRPWGQHCPAAAWVLGVKLLLSPRVGKSLTLTWIHSSTCRPSERHWGLHLLGSSWAGLCGRARVLVGLVSSLKDKTRSQRGLNKEPLNGQRVWQVCSVSTCVRLHQKQPLVPRATSVAL